MILQQPTAKPYIYTHYFAGIVKFKIELKLERFFYLLSYTGAGHCKKYFNINLYRVTFYI